jgi:hypothetical protein
MKKELIAIASAIVLGLAGAAWAAPTPGAPARQAMSKDAYEAGQARIEAQYRTDEKTCKRARGHARDLCEAQARGKEKAAAARLAALYRPGPEATQEAKFAVAEANYDVAKVICDARKGKAKSRCVDQAKAAREAAQRQARVEKVDATGGIFGKDGDADKGRKS